MLDKSQNGRQVNSRLLAEAAGVRVVMTTPDVKDATTIAGASRISLELRLEGVEVKSDKKFLGFHLTRSKWDPYPWIGYVETGSVADLAGLRAGDCLLSIAGNDLIGLRVKEVASLIRGQVGSTMRAQVWRSLERDEQHSDSGVALSGPLPEVARKLAKAVSGTISALECPVCLDSAASPVAQCVHGHILCVGCRARTPRCPVCRVRLGQGRCLLADELQRNIRGFDKAASAENLSSAHNEPSNRPAAYRRLNELTQSDRTKSASTGELSLADESRTDSSLGPRSAGLLSVPQTPTWGGSTESVDDSSFRCPLSRSTACRRTLSVHSVLEHLASSHDGPQVRFSGKIARIPWPFPFVPATYLISHRGLFFFVQCENESVWISSSGSDDLGEWTLIGTNENNQIFESRRIIARLNDDSAPLPRHLVSMPKNLDVDTLVIQLLDLRPEGYRV